MTEVNRTRPAGTGTFNPRSVLRVYLTQAVFSGGMFNVRSVHHVCSTSRIFIWGKFNLRSVYRVCLTVAGVFIDLGLSGVIPAMHVVITDGFWSAVNDSALGWLSLMAVLYIVGALIYAARVPERILPGRFDIWVSGFLINIFSM